MMNINVSKFSVWANTELFNPEHSDFILATTHESSIVRNPNRAFYHISSGETFQATKLARNELSVVDAHGAGKYNPSESEEYTHALAKRTSSASSFG